MLDLEVDQTTSRLLWSLLSTPRVVGGLLLHETSLLGHTGILLAEEGVVAGLGGMQTIQTLTSGVDECTRRRVLRRDTQVANVSERVLALARCKKRIKTGVVRVCRLRWGAL